jgi:methionyl-tRNA formyltransferase
MVSALPLRVVFFGTPGFAVPTLDAVLASRHPVAAVVTQPDRPRGRGQKTTDAPVKARALEAGLPVLQPETLKDQIFRQRLIDLHADIGVVAAYGKILPEAVIGTPRLGMINVHASLLPKYRGAAPVHRAVIAGEPETGVTIMRIVKALDAGPMLAEAVRSIRPDETSAELEGDLASLGAGLLVSTLERLSEGPMTEVPQDDGAATYAPRLSREDGFIDWERTAAEIHNLVRGLHPWPLAQSFVNGQRLIVRRSSARDATATSPAGTIVAARGDELRVAAGAGVLDLLEIQAEGRRPMTPREFLSGHRLQPGDRFTKTP